MLLISSTEKYFTIARKKRYVVREDAMIFYYTGTGNSQMVAETIARCNGDTLVNIAAAMKAGEYTYTIGGDETVGFVMPTYYYGIPIRIPDFIGAL